MEWKEPFAWCIMLLYIFFILGSLALFYKYSDKYPIQRSNRSFELLCCTVLGSLVSLVVPGEDISPGVLNCRAHYALFGVMLPLFFLPALMNYVRYVVKCESQALISALANTCIHERVHRSHTMDQLPAPQLSFSGQVDQTKSIQDHLLLIQKRTTTRTLLQVSGIFVAVYVVARAMINYSISGNSLGVGADYCGFIPGGVIMDTTFVILFYCSIWLLVGYSAMNGYVDDYGVRTDYQLAMISAAPFLIVYFLDRWEAVEMGFAHHDSHHHDHEEFQADYMILFAFVLAIFFLITRPALRAMMGGRVKVVEENEHRLELILSSSAYDLFVDHLRREFCSELILFWRQVAFIKLSNEGGPLPYLVAEDMWLNFISDDAPFQINIPHSMRKPIEDTLNAAKVEQSDVPWTLFDEAQREVYHLMERDCLPRFILSQEWRTFIAGKGGALAVVKGNVGTEAMVQAISIAQQSGAIRGSISTTPDEVRSQTVASRKSSWTNRVSDWLQSKRSLAAHDSMNAPAPAEAPDAVL